MQTVNSCDKNDGENLETPKLKTRPKFMRYPAQQNRKASLVPSSDLSNGSGIYNTFDAAG